MDDADRAKLLEQAAREAALNAQRARAHETERARERGGQRICRDCAAPIPAARLAVRPNAVRCVRCQEKKERSR